MCGYYSHVDGKLNTQKLFDCGFIGVWLCAVLTVLWVVN